MMAEASLIEEYLAKHGARRFEKGASSDFHRIASFLAEYGYQVSGSPKGAVRVRHGRGPVRKMGMPKLIEMVDEIRAAQGLQPFSASRNQAA